MTTSTTTNRFFVYARKSTDDVSRQVRSIGDQLAELRELATKESIHVVDTLVEKQSAKTPGRPVFNEMLERIERGEANGILAWHPDRLARNSLDAGRVVWLVDTGKIKELKFPTFSFDPNATGKLMLAIMFGQSKYYVDNLSENIRRGHRQKLKNGLWPQLAPVGYLNDRKAKTIYPDPERAPLVRKAFELHASGSYTLDRLLHTMRELGLTSRKGGAMSRAQCHRMLQNHLYYGVIQYNGELYPGAHEPIISKQLYDAVQAVMERKSKPKTPALKPYLYRGLLRCGECGCFITTETQKGHNYLRCTKRVKKDCSQPFVREEVVSQQIAAALDLVALPETYADEMIASFEAEQRTDKTSSQEVLRGFDLKIQEADAKLQRLMDAYVEGTLTLAEYRESKNRLIESKKLLEEHKQTTERNRSGWFEPAIRFVKAAKTKGFLAKSQDRLAQLEEFKKTGSNLLLLNRELRWEPRGAWQILMDSGRFAQHETPAPQRGAGAVGETDQNPEMRRR